MKKGDRHQARPPVYNHLCCNFIFFPRNPRALANQPKEYFRNPCADFTSPYSHSIVPGGLLVMSYTTRLTPCT
jgi:hypothetical protein